MIHPASTSWPPRTGGRHRKQPEHRWRPISIGLMAAGAVSVLLATVVMITALAAKLSARDSTYTVGARTLQPERTGAPRPAQSAQPAQSHRAYQASQFAFDHSGFIGSQARCQDHQTARAIGRTTASLVVICLDRSGRFEYHGVRLSDDAALAAVAQTGQARRFVARNHEVSYAVSSAELLVTSGKNVIKKEPMVEYREILSTPIVVAPR
ncbi:hypothetical protein M1247_15780 [Mycobacterium sp. 21AC1]|uniref:hypothetical protein n=1 Tax=[Mycobacterium] appelbergii TaxID=2939269 RepID=UPI002939522E|nr:hypothetical protein [Mycobacterium sp. 21AC1]MDV3126381.1 hypothetical protein [Mycobacterium sp. 21AC1]